MNSSVVPADRRTRRLLQQIDISTRRKLVPEFKTPEVVFVAGSNRSFAVQCSSLVRLVLPMVHLRGTGESSAKESFGLWGGGGNLSHTHTDVRLQPLVYDILRAGKPRCAVVMDLCRSISGSEPVWPSGKAVGW